MQRVVDQDAMRAQIVADLNMSHLPQEEQDELIEHLGSVLLDNATLSIIERMPKEKVEEVEALAQEGRQDEANAIIRASVPDVDTIVANEIQSGLLKYVQYLNEQVANGQTA